MTTNNTYIIKQFVTNQLTNLNWKCHYDLRHALHNIITEYNLYPPFLYKFGQKYRKLSENQCHLDDTIDEIVQYITRRQLVESVEEGMAKRADDDIQFAIGEHPLVIADAIEPKCIFTLSNANAVEQLLTKKHSLTTFANFYDYLNSNDEIPSYRDFVRMVQREGVYNNSVLRRYNTALYQQNHDKIFELMEEVQMLIMGNFTCSQDAIDFIEDNNKVPPLKYVAKFIIDKLHHNSYPIILKYEDIQTSTRPCNQQKTNAKQLLINLI